MSLINNSGVLMWGNFSQNLSVEAIVQPGGTIKHDLKCKKDGSCTVPITAIICHNWKHLFIFQSIP